jgi:uncharacterized protein
LYHHVHNMEGFEWDKGNSDKNLRKHKVTNKECEEVFFNKPLILYRDVFHSQSENRYTALGKSNAKRHLYIAFSIRNKNIRIISGRDQSRRERRIYEKTK